MVTNLNGSATVPGSLPYAVANANPGDTIQFAPTLTGGTITLGNTLDVNKDLSIDGRDNRITVNGGGHRVFLIQPKVAADINALTITGGAPSGAGGGIFNLGSLSLSNSTVTGNSAVNGGGISNGGTMTMSGDTVTSNTATDPGGGYGGGVFNEGHLTIINCTIAANAAHQGGGIANYYQVLDVVNSTVASNTVTGAGADGGGIFTNAQLALLNTIVYNPNSGASTHNEVLGTITQVEGVVFGPGPFNVAPGGDHGGSKYGLDPLLGPLQDNGGPTATMALLPGSPAIGHGVSASLIPGLAVPGSDQRGDPRPAGSTDVGAFQATALTAHQRFVEALYLDFLHRTGDLNNPNDAGGWVLALDQGTPAATVANGIARSVEALGIDVDGLYQRFLGRAADPAGRAGFVAYLQNGGTLEGVSQMMLASAEYQSHFPTDAAFVQSLYQNLLQRPGSNAEVGGWLAVLPQLGRTGVAQAFLSSQEYRYLEVVDDYTQLLDRTQPPGAVEVNGWVGTGLDLLMIDARIASSPEYQTNG
jgi:hypothetical protein